MRRSISGVLAIALSAALLSAVNLASADTAGANITVKPCVYAQHWGKHALTFSYGGKHLYLGNAWQAAKNWTDLKTGISITPAPAGQIADIVITDNSYPTASWIGKTMVRFTHPWPYVPTTFHIVTHIHLLLNKPLMEDLTDTNRTITITHELGHALGLAHSSDCGITAPSIMNASPSVLFQSGYSTPQFYDMVELEMLYGLPTPPDPPPPPPPPSKSVRIGWSASHPSWISMRLAGFGTGQHQYTCHFPISGGDATFTLTETTDPQTWDNGHTCFDTIRGDQVQVIVSGTRSNTITVP